MKLLLRQGILVIFIICCNTSYALDLLADSESSFAEKYKDLRILLQKVTSVELAVHYKDKIDHEINILRKNQITSAVDYKSLSDKEKKLFIKKFQKNRFHCGEVTGVANERRRIMLHPELATILRESLDRIP